ncbi:hypothetical protein LWF15_27095 [Kineosporia rhizophila]|uniref:hypothetical protein n=1 Tax=Kineosporia rhizophila TaxID=84633 RepID=UPI001E28A581|nr:hypothetical protein [Kineosporia rhizophila]MCE0539173.1 hypothetical protein [Kineosporia rhizophila]
MLNLDAVDWSGLTHAHGEADDVPLLLTRLREGEWDDWNDAVDELYVALMHDRVAHPATLAALPFLVQVALDRESEGRLGALQLIDHYTGFAADCGPQAVAALERATRDLAELVHDPEPEVRRAVYGSAPDWPDPVSLLRARLDAEADAELLVDLVTALARRGVLTAADLDTFAARGQDEVVFSGAWAMMLAGSQSPEAIEYLARLWSAQAKVNYGAGDGYPLCDLVEKVSGRALALLDRLGETQAVSLAELAWAWHDAAVLARSAYAPASRALLGLIARAGQEDAADLLAAMLPLLPETQDRQEAADAVYGLLERCADPASDLLAAFATALFALRDTRWSGPALAATRGEPPWIAVGAQSVEFASALESFKQRTGVGPWAHSGLLELVKVAITAWPGTADAWTALLESLPPSSDLVEVLLSGGVPSKAALRLLARTAAERPGVFDVATYQVVQELPVSAGDSGAWLLVLQALLGSGDAAAFARAWRMSESGAGEDELLRIWATHPSAELEQVCLDLATRTTWGTHRSRAVQVAALQILFAPVLSGRDADPDPVQTLWKVLLSLTPQLGVCFGAAVELGNRLVTVRPQWRAEWVARLNDLVGQERPAGAVAIEALQALGAADPQSAVVEVLADLQALAGTRKGIHTVPAAARVIHRALAESPELRPRVAGSLTALIDCDERVLAPGDITLDSYLVRTLEKAL